MAGKVLLMLSGGRDSFLAACRLLEDPAGYEILMATYDNGCSRGSADAALVASRIAAKYGEDRARFLGVYPTGPVARGFFAPYFNMVPEEQSVKYPGMMPSQFHCLICRTSMYVYSAWLAMLNGARYVAEGARESQGFAVELPGMARDRYPALMAEAGLGLLLPVYNLKDDWERDDELLLRGFLSKSLEPKCLIGFPLGGPVRTEGVHAYYDNEMLPRIRERELLAMRAAELYAGSGPEMLDT